MNLRVIKERIAERYDPDYLVDVLDITSEELLAAFPDKLLVKIGEDEFLEVLNPGEED